jgi:hypothetical protein
MMKEVLSSFWLALVVAAPCVGGNPEMVREKWIESEKS